MDEKKAAEMTSRDHVEKANALLDERSAGKNENQSRQLTIEAQTHALMAIAKSATRTVEIE